MRDLLVPIFGEWGAVVAQFLLTVVIVFGLIGAVWWFVRRYSGVHFGGIGRGRVPRLAIIDAIPVDRRRRLVLVRRDNIEHLLLVGGPSDVVVEGGIQRVRQRSAQTAAQVAAARAAMQSAVEAPPETPQLEAPSFEMAEPEPLATNEPIPFPAARNAPTRPAAGNGRSLFRAGRQPPPVSVPEASAPQPSTGEPLAAPPEAPGARFVEVQRPTRLQALRSGPVTAPPEPLSPEPAPEAQSGPDPGAFALADQDFVSEVMTAEREPRPPAPPPATFAAAELEAAEAARQSALDLGDVEGDTEAPAMTTAEDAGPGAAEAEAPPPAPPNSAARVSDLEREMARLLGEITTRRST